MYPFHTLRHTPLLLIALMFSPLALSGPNADATEHSHQSFADPAQIPPLHSQPEQEQRQLPFLNAQPAQQNAPTCDAEELAGYTGQRLIQALTAQNPVCINDLFRASGNTARQLFSEDQMRTVAQGVERLATTYPGSNRDGILQLALYLRAGYYVQFYSDGLIPSYSGALKREAKAALERFFSNPNVNQVSEQHGKVLREVITLIDSAGVNLDYLWLAEDMLSRFDDRFQQSRSMTAAVNSVFSILFRAHNNPDFSAQLEQGSGLIDALYQFTEQHGALLGSEQEYVLINAVRELGRFLQHEGAAKRKTAGYLRQLLQRYDMTGPGASLWVVAASFVDSFDKENCAGYGVCNFKSSLEQRLLSYRHECSSTIVIRAQQMAPAELEESCQVLGKQEREFHRKLETQEQPVADDHNRRLEVVVFNSSSDYQSYAGVLYNISTDNGGMYLEGNPTDINNQARFVAYEAEWKRPNVVVWNLEHEYVHYLDGRFNLWGDFGQSSANDTIWWIEGLAEYISQRNSNPEAVAIAQSGDYSLSELFRNSYNHDADRTYRWGYLAVRYMFEHKHQDVRNLLDLFRSGQYEDYQYYIDGIGQQYDAEFARWLTSVGSTEPEEPEEPEEPVDTDCADDASVDFRELVANQKKCGIEDSGKSYFYLYVQQESDRLRFDLDTREGTTELYVSRDNWPSARRFDDADTGSGNRKSVTIESPEVGAYYMVRVTHSGARDLALTATFEDGTPGANDSQLISGQPRNFHLDNQAYFYIYVPENSHWLYLTLTGGQSDNRLYVMRNGWPDNTRFDQSSTHQGSAQYLVVSPVKSGNYYHVMVETDTPGEVTLNALVQ